MNCPNCSVELSQKGDRLCCPAKGCGFTMAVSTVKRFASCERSGPAKDPDSTPEGGPQRSSAFVNKEAFEAWRNRRDSDMGRF